MQTLSHCPSVNKNPCSLFNYWILIFFNSDPIQIFKKNFSLHQILYFNFLFFRIFLWSGSAFDWILFCIFRVAEGASQANCPGSVCRPSLFPALRASPTPILDPSLPWEQFSEVSIVPIYPGYNSRPHRWENLKNQNANGLALSYYYFFIYIPPPGSFSVLTWR